MAVILGEFEDQNWFPSRLRNYQTDFLGTMSSALRLYRDCPEIIRGFEGAQIIVDLASGNGKAAVEASKFFREKGGSVFLTDKFPNEGTVRLLEADDSLNYATHSINALEDSLPEGDLYTMFNSLHHFKKTDIIDLIEKLHRKKKNLIFAEPLQPNIQSFLKVLFATTIGCLLITPFVKPFRWDRFALTYLIPLGLIVTFWDGISSVLKSLPQDELLNMVAELNEKGIPIELKVEETTFAKIQYLVL